LGEVAGEEAGFQRFRVSGFGFEPLSGQFSVLRFAFCVLCFLDSLFVIRAIGDCIREIRGLLFVGRVSMFQCFRVSGFGFEPLSGQFSVLRFVFFVLRFAFWLWAFGR